MADHRSSGDVLGVCAAGVILVPLPRRDDGGTVWFVVDPASTAASVEAARRNRPDPRCRHSAPRRLRRRRKPWCSTVSTTMPRGTSLSRCRRARPPALSDGPWMRSPRTCARGSSSASPSAPSRRCSTKRRCCSSTANWPRRRRGTRCAPSMKRRSSGSWPPPARPSWLSRRPPNCCSTRSRCSAPSGSRGNTTFTCTGDAPPVWPRRWDRSPAGRDDWASWAGRTSVTCR